jgi:hypothetical protein
MTDTLSFRSLTLPARDAQTFNAYLHLPFEPVALEMMQIPASADDVFIATFPKSGTTWMQQICHGLRSRGDMNFKEVGWVAPWLERGHMFGIDSRIAQHYTPRLFKTHLPYAQVNKGARYIHVIRDPKDVLVSFYGFLSHGLIDPAALSIETFADCWLLGDQLAERSDPSAPVSPYLYNYWQHLLDWWAARAQAPVLSLAYEHLRRDLEPQVARIAQFMGVKADDALLYLATHQAGFDFMAAHQEQFSDEIVGIPHRLRKVVSGEVGRHKLLLSPALVARVDVAWQRYVTPVTGATCYEEFIAALP